MNIPWPDENPAKIREWARQNGYDVPDRGPIPADARDAYRNARHDEILDKNREDLFEELRQIQCCPTCGVPQVAPEEVRKLAIPALDHLVTDVMRRDVNIAAELATIRRHLHDLESNKRNAFEFQGLLLRCLERIEQRLAALEIASLS